MYCDYNDLVAKIDESTLIQLSDDNNEGYVDQTVIDVAISSACAEIDGYLATRYPVPVTTAVPVLKPCAVDLTVYNMYSRKSAGPPEHIIGKYDNWIKFLSKIAEGKIDLIPEAETVSGGTSQVDAGDRVFTRSTMTGF